MTPTPRNVLWITCDEMKASAASVYGNAFTSMPAAERLARGGMCFDHAYVQMPKCVPSRCSMMSGRYPHCDGFRTLKGGAGAAPGPRGEDNSMLALRADTPNLIPIMRQRGYRTCLLGKNHLVDWRLHREWFDVTPSWNYARQVPCLPDRVTPRMKAGQLEYAGMIDPTFDMNRHMDVVTATEAITFLEDCQRARQPFFALVDIAKPHPTYEDYPDTPAAQLPLESLPLPPRQPLDRAPAVERMLRTSRGLEELDEHERRTVLRAYYSMCEFADRQVNRILDALDRLDLTRNTLVIYTSDHGDFAGEHGCFEKWDTLFYDCLVRVPLLMRLPGAVPAGARSEALVELIDIAPTILEHLGLTPPRWMHGRSLGPLMRTEVTEHRTAVFCQGGVEPALTQRPWSPPDPTPKQRVLLEHPQTMVRAHMVRDRDLKYVYRLEGEEELYDLRADPWELTNIASDPAYRHRLLMLKDRLLRFLVEFETDLPQVDHLIA